MNKVKFYTPRLNFTFTDFCSKIKLHPDSFVAILIIQVPFPSSHTMSPHLTFENKKNKKNDWLL